MEIRVDDLKGDAIAEFLREHLEDMAQHSPPESMHALDLERLRRPEITFWSAWVGDELVGTGALKELDPHHGEIKSMRTSQSHRREGVATELLRTILHEATRRGYARVSLETGSMEAFSPARALYANFGFRVCPPFGDYVEDPYSVYMTKELGPAQVSARKR
jgi:putative acetyltransferase